MVSDVRTRQCSRHEIYIHSTKPSLYVKAAQRVVNRVERVEWK